MNRELCREQEEKCAAAYKFHVEELGLDHYHLQEYLDAWKDCLAANGIGETHTDSSAPQWVIDMMRTGRPVLCKCWCDYPEDEKEYQVTGYNIRTGIFYTDGNGSYRNAEPIPAWKPKDGEAVLFRHRESVGAEWKTALGTFSKGRIYFGDHRMSAILLCLKPFDGDYEQIGRPWGEI